MKKTVWVLLAVAIGLSGAGFYRTLHGIKVAYIRSSDMVYSYEGMKDAQKAYQDKINIWQGNVDTLRVELEHSINQYNNELTKLSEKEKAEKQNLLSRQQQSYTQYAESIKEKSKKEEEDMTQGVLNQINSFVEQYAKEKGYDMVFGTTTSGNIMYARDYMDITQEVLKALNENYHTPVTSKNN
jgi:outer membrane protein